MNPGTNDDYYRPLELEDTTAIEVIPPTPLHIPTGREVVDGLKEGSWAVLIALGVIFFLGRGYLAKYVAAQLSALEALRNSTVSNAEAIQSIAEVDDKVAETLSRLEQSANVQKDTLTQLATTIARDNKVILAHLKYLVAVHKDIGSKTDQK